MKEVIKKLCGDAAVTMFPAKREALATGAAVPRGKLEKLICDSLIRRAAESGDHSQLRKRLSQYWQGDAGDAFYEKFADRFESSFLGPHYPVVEALKSVVNSSSGTYSEVYEIGCGDGRVLQHLSKELNGIDTFTGLDINERIIAKNREVYSETELQFAAGDAIELLEQNAKPGTVLMSYGGVMEYFPQADLLRMFELLKTRAPSVVALVEPLYDGFDIEAETESRPSGQEHSFSHNHRHLLEKAGFEIVFQSEPETEFRWVMIVARS